MFNENLWNQVVSSLGLRDGVPDWVRNFLQLPLADIQGMPLASLISSTDILRTETVFCPTLELEEVTPSYLDFLRTQIKLEPKGKEWADNLRGRLEAIVPYENQKLFQMTIMRIHKQKIESFFAKFHPDDLRIIHIECC